MKDNPKTTTGSQPQSLPPSKGTMEFLGGIGPVQYFFSDGHHHVTDFGVMMSTKSFRKLAQRIDAYILAETLKAKPEKQIFKGGLDNGMSDQMHGYNVGISDYESNLIAKFGKKDS